MKRLPVLVVEDDADLREALVDTLELSGFSVVEASDGETALEVLRREPVGLVVSDAQMQPMDGYTLFSHIKDRYPGLPFVLMTAYGVIERAIELLRAGASHYLLKPFEPQRLIDEVERFLLDAPEVAAESMVAESPAMKQIVSVASRVAPSDASVLITGPVAQARKCWPVSCTSIRAARTARLSP